MNVVSDGRGSISLQVALEQLSTEYNSYSACITEEQQCIDRYDDLLQRIMTVLSDLPDIPLNSFVSKDENSTQQLIDSYRQVQPVFLDDVVASLIEGTTKSFPRMIAINRWSEVAPFLALDPNSTEDATSTVVHHWEQALLLVHKVTSHMSPLETHSTIVSLENAVPDDDDDSIRWKEIGGCQMYHITCILLCCRALHHLTTKPEKSLRPRWQRCQSLLFETIRQFERLYIHFGDIALILDLSLSLWINHVVPSTSQWNSVVWNEYFPIEHIHIPTDRVRIWRWFMAYEAITIAISGRMAYQIVTQGKYNHDYLRSLQSRIHECIVFGHINWICEHFFRSYYILVYKNHEVLQMYRKTLMSEHGPTKTNALMYFTLLDGCDEGDDERLDLLCGLSTTWSNINVAILSYAGWELRPYVWSKGYIWHSFFPCINHLLNGEVTEDIEDAESLRRVDTISPFGFMLMSQLSAFGMIHSIKMPSNDKAPDNPLGTFQLLFNFMITGGKRQSVITATECFRYAKWLLNVYQPCSQIRIVKQLLLCCPYPNIRPKIIDLLRTFVDWNDTQGQLKVWSFIDELIFIELEDRLSLEMTPSNMGILIENAEVYMATLGLLQVWVKRKRALPMHINIRFTRESCGTHTHLAKTLARLHSLLIQTIKSIEKSVPKCDNSSTSSPTSLHLQLNLLENIMNECIEDVKKNQN